MSKILLLDPIAKGKSFLRHRHLLRDWSGHSVPGYVPFPPLDLMYAASYLRRYRHDVQIIEASVKHWPNSEIIRIIANSRPNFVFIPSTYISLDDDKHLARLIRRNAPKTKIIFSGPLLTYVPSLVLSDDSADFVVLGECELPLLDILKGEYSYNVAYKSGNKIIIGKRSLLDINELPIPARDLIDNQAYQYAIFNKRNPVTAMSISRGCPHSQCNFCHAKLFSLGEIRYRNINSIFEELSEIVFKYGIGEIMFRDQVFTANRELVWHICEYILSRKINIAWRAATRVDFVDKELLTIMHRAGCYQLSFGFESNSQKSLDANNKGITIEQSKQAAKWAKESEIEILGLFMFGLPGDTKKSIKRLFRFSLDLGIDYANFNEIYLNPGIPVYDKYIENNSTLLPLKLNKRFAMYSYLKFYLRPKFLLKLLGKIKSWKDFNFIIRAGLESLLPYF